MTYQLQSLQEVSRHQFHVLGQIMRAVRYVQGCPKILHHHLHKGKVACLEGSVQWSGAFRATEEGPRPSPPHETDNEWTVGTHTNAHEARQFHYSPPLSLAFHCDFLWPVGLLWCVPINGCNQLSEVVAETLCAGPW